MKVEDLVLEILRKVGEKEPEDSTKDVGLDAVKTALRAMPLHAKTRGIVKIASPITLTTGNSSIDLSTITDFVSERFVWRLVSGSRTPINKKDPEFMHSYYTTASTGPPEFYYIHGTTMEFGRPANQDYSIYIEYYCSSSNVTLDSTLTFDDNIIQVIKHGALEVLYDHRENDAKSEKEGKKFQAGLFRIDADFQRQEMPDHIEETN